MYLIYKITNMLTGLSYVGLTKRFSNRMNYHRRELTVGCTDFQIEILWEDIPSLDEANEMEKVFIHIHDTFHNGANKTTGGGSNVEVSDSTRQKHSLSAKSRVVKGLHNFQGSESNISRVNKGTHPWLSGEVQRKTQINRVKNGTHNFLGGEIQRRRVSDGTHHFLGSSNPTHKQLKSGTHAFLRRSTPILSKLTISKYKIVFYYVALLPKVYWEGLNSIYTRTD